MHGTRDRRASRLPQREDEQGGEAERSESDPSGGHVKGGVVAEQPKLAASA